MINLLKTTFKYKGTEYKYFTVKQVTEINEPISEEKKKWLFFTEKINRPPTYEESSDRILKAAVENGLKPNQPVKDVNNILNKMLGLK